MILLGAGAAAAQNARPPEKAPLPPSKIWLARELAQLTEQQVWLFGTDGSSVGIARPEQLRALLGVFGKMEHQSGVNSELYLAEGAEPDTWLAQGKGDQVVIRVSLGLVTMLGSDWDAWAFVIGHQLAHIEILRLRGPEALRDATVTTIEEEERVADALGVEYAVRGGYKPDGAALFLQRIAMRERPSSLFMRRHPFYPGRIDHVREVGSSHAARR
jgi:Zn-dependent protease with chaperone function